MQRLAPILLLLASGLLAGCAGFLLDETATPEAVKHLRQSIYKEFDLLVKDFDEADGKGDLELCAPVRFAVTRFAVYQAVEEKKTARLDQLSRFIVRARRALLSSQSRSKAGECVDSDGDGLTDLTETRRYRTNPSNADTDGDGLSDGLEVRRYGTSPLRYDQDGDLLSDGEEALFLKTNPRHPDSDGDGYADGLEVAAGADPLDACSKPSSGPRLPGPWRKCLRPAADKGFYRPSPFGRSIRMRNRRRGGSLSSPSGGNGGRAPRARGR